MPPRKSTTRGFKRTSGLLQDRIKHASASRGFEQSRLLTHWPEIVGDAIAAIARPVNISYGRGGFGASLTVLTTGPQAPMLEMQKEKLREKVNGIYGYNAISRILITQTAPTGFAEGQVSFAHRTKPATPQQPDPETTAKAADMTAPVGDADLRVALAALAANVLNKQKR